MANESYEDFAKALQTEYTEDCGVTFGKVPLTAFAKLTRVVDGKEIAIGKERAEVIRISLIKQEILDEDSYIQPAFDPKREGFTLGLPDEDRDIEPAVIDLLSSYQIERHVRKATDQRTNYRLKKEVLLSHDFKELWDRIKPRTAYRVEFETHTLVCRAVDEIKRMERIETPSVRVDAAKIDVEKGGVTATTTSVVSEQADYHNQPVPDLLAYLQNETELTRSTIVRILKESGRLGELFNNPQRFMDSTASILKHTLHRLLVDGIKYEPLDKASPDSEWEMMLFKNEELINYLSAQPVNKSVYDNVVYDSEIENEFAKGLDERDDIKLFVKLPGWFEIDTPVGKYNPDWAILKDDGQSLYLVRETKGTKDFLKLRTTEADKIRCGKQHFEALGVDFKVAVTASEV